jgi:hypothetical protein
VTQGKEKASGHAEVYTYSLLFEAAHHALNAAKPKGAPATHFCLLSLVASAFCLEAYLNELGERRLKLWSQPEKYSPRRKLDLICSKIGMTPDFEARPFSSFAWVMKFRNSVAHGRTEVVTFHDVPTRDDIDAPDRPPTSLELACDVGTASAVVQDVREMVDAVGKKAGSVASPLLVFSHSAWVITPIE